MVEEVAIAHQEGTSAYVEHYLSEDEPVLAARRRSEEVGAGAPVGASGGAALRFVAAALNARATVEVGTGTGVSGIYLLRGMHADGILTTVDAEPEYQRLARTAYAEAGFAPPRTRLITGRALEVLARLTDGGYDLVFCDTPEREYGNYLQEALRLLRPGGVVAFDHALASGKVADPAQRDPDTTAVRELGREMRDDERLLPALLPVSDGLLVAAKR